MRIPIFLAVIAASLAVAVGASSASIKDTTYSTQTWSNVLDYVLNTESCPQFQLARSTGLVAEFGGLYGPYDSESLYRDVRLTAIVTGTVVDTAGNVYEVWGHFKERDSQFLFDSDLEFNGDGRVEINGPNGRLSGRANFRVVSGPRELDIYFTEIRACNFG